MQIKTNSDSNAAGHHKVGNKTVSSEETKALPMHYSYYQTKDFAKQQGATA